MPLSATPSTPSLLLAIGTGFAGITTGLTLSWPVIWYGPLEKSSNSETVRLLHGSYKNATRCIPPMLLATTAFFCASKYSSHKTLVSLPALFAFINIPWTFLAVFPVNAQLFRKEADPVSVVDKDNSVNALLKKWMYVHSARILFAASATVLGLAELLH
ncbi:hypothetical protein E3P99_00399 [Wallemia hederae]|uniref:DUF1772 domain-containing protein n=1 Tax=Wallemia hederae TaxID=1540922 RepID=A0A4T0G0L4_9BASI|nr:hypothetical protein E3P99_00399 [Wallemia hederae]